ncbi:hypothetical protein CBM2595_A70016 [Cupriavidus taiwanensis]|nr:hypothetical protein CBM2595_A70016 [Cupriavidus taiwanensis]
MAHAEIFDTENPRDDVRHHRRARNRWRRRHAHDASTHDGRARRLLGDGVASLLLGPPFLFNRRISIVKDTPISTKCVSAILPSELF